MKQPKLKIGDLVKVINKGDIFYNEVGKITNDSGTLYKYEVEFDISKLDSLGFMTSSGIFKESELQLIKPKTKKVKKYKYSRKEIVKMIKTKCFFGHNESKAVRWLLATQPQPVKEEPNTNSKEIDDDIDPIEIETDLSTKRKYVDGLEITQLDEFLIDKINLMILFINSLTNRK